MLGKLTREHTVNVEDLREVLAAGASREQIKGAFAVFFAFNVTDRLANAFEFEILSQEGFNAGAKFLLIIDNHNQYHKRMSGRKYN